MYRFATHARALALIGLAILTLVLTVPVLMPPGAVAAPAATLAVVAASGEAGSLEAAATKAGETGRKVAMSMIGLGFAIASIVMVFRRDFKEAVGVLAIGLLAIMLATPTGVNVLHNTVNSLFGTSG